MKTCRMCSHSITHEFFDASSQSVDDYSRMAILLKSHGQEAYKKDSPFVMVIDLRQLGQE